MTSALSTVFWAHGPCRPPTSGSCSSCTAGAAWPPGQRQLPSHSPSLGTPALPLNLTPLGPSCKCPRGASLLHGGSGFRGHPCGCRAVCLVVEGWTVFLGVDTPHLLHPHTGWRPSAGSRAPAPGSHTMASTDLVSVPGDRCPEAGRGLRRPRSWLWGWATDARAEGVPAGPAAGGRVSQRTRL